MVLGVDQVAVIVLADRELDPVDLAREQRRFHAGPGEDGRPELTSDLETLRRGEEHGLRDGYLPLPYLFAVVVERDVATLGKPFAGVRKLGPNLMLSGREPLLRVG